MVRSTVMTLGRLRVSLAITLGVATVGCANSKRADVDIDASVAEPDAPDVPIPDAGPDGPPKHGFGEPCNDRGQCESNLCILGGPSGVCTMECGAQACPDGFGCIGVLGVDIDGVVTHVCVPETNQLCSPCQQDSECSAVGMDKCLTYPDGDRYCSRDCTSIGCPMGYACETVDVGGSDFQQCVPTSAACDCDADNPGATEPCTIMTPHSTVCQGQRTCGGASGWGACEPPTPTDDPDDAFVDSNCDGIDGDAARAIFVSLVGDDSATCGLVHTNPCATIQYGIARALAESRVHVYVQKGTYPESLRMENGISVYGGYAVDWQRDTYANAANRVLVSGGMVAVSVANITLPTTLDNLVIRSANATTTGGSSYGIRVTGSQQVAIRNVLVEPGAGGDGSDGSDGSVGAAGGLGGNGNPGCEDSSGTCGNCSWPTGGGGGSSSCGRPGGAGGRPGHGEPTHGDPDIGSTGRRGGDGTVASGGGGAGGAGGGLHGDGNVGAPGDPGTPGSNGSGGESFGGFNGLVYTTAAGSSGTLGNHGHGGGGGGGGGGGDRFCDSYGSSGGGGGGGGCGGTAGTRGTGGGGSFGMVVLDSAVALHRSVVNGGLGGDGGRGGLGGTGGQGGRYGNGGQYGGSDDQDDAGNGARGGMGGNGGRGGHGGGGGGGPSIGVVCLGTVTLEQTSTTLAGGLGGTGGASSGSPGAAGTTAGSLNCP